MIGILSSGRILNKRISGDKYSQGISIPINYDNAYNYGVNNNPYALKQIIDNNTGEEHNFNWDLKGNMIYHKDINAGNERHLCWTEDNRLQAVKDNKMGAYYNYDASGERNLKLTGGTVDVVGEPVFYYHSDHLGSASYITDSSGYETQHLVYLPFGEDWVDMKYNTSQFETPYKFNGKEKDPETGYNYYGARYLNTDLSIWLSVDPMSDKYPHVTNYIYCSNNPVMVVDPNGEDEYEVNVISQEIKKIKESDNDIVHLVNEKGRTSSKPYAKGTIKGFTNTTYNEDETLSYLDVDGEENAKSLFEFFADNSTNKEGKQPLEWGNVQTDEGGGSKGNYVGTSFKEAKIGMLGYMKTLGNNIIKGSHNHPKGSDPSTTDMDNAANYPAGTILNVYVSTKGGVYTQYNNKGIFVGLGDGTKVLNERNK